MSEIADLLRDPLWQFIGVIIAIVSVSTAIFLSLRQRNRKAISYRIISSTPVLSVSEGVEGKLKILYENQEVKEVQLVVISVTNTGNVPIVENDYAQPLEVSFGMGKLLTVEIMEKTPKELDITPLVSGGKVVINKALLNQGDSFVFRALVAGFKDTINVNARIVGIKAITKQVEPAYTRNSFIGMMVLYAGFVGIIVNNNSLKDTTLLAFSYLVIVLGLVIVCWNAIRQVMYKKRTNKKKKRSNNTFIRNIGMSQAR